jgi:hypothetical protein
MPTDTVSIEKLTRTFEAGKTRYIVTAEIKPTRAVAPYLNLDLLPVDPNAKALSVSALVYERNKAGRWECRGGGQSQDGLRADFPDDPTAQRLCDIWDAYHLCDMKSGNREQEAIITEWAAKCYPGGAHGAGRYDYTDACTILANAGKLDVPIPEASRKNFEHKRDRETGEYPTTYRYGTAWLCGALPAEVEAELRALMTPPPDAPKPASPEAENRGQLARLGIKMSCQYADRNPNMPDAHDMNHYKCTFSRGRSRMTVYFSMGYAHTSEPTINQVFDTLVQDAATVENCGDFAGFCSELGYDEDSRAAERTWKALEHAAKRLRTFLGEDLYTELVSV